ncbi:MAG: hypothetical protein ABSC19_09675 [Syntrophorhabdales bacterium]|jgi:biotin carboxylase
MVLSACNPCSCEGANEIGYPVIIKPSGGGGGIGMAIVPDEGETLAALESTRSIATATLAPCDVYLESYLSDPRHIEFQIMGDSKGNVIRLGERDQGGFRERRKGIPGAGRRLFSGIVSNKCKAIQRRWGRNGYRGNGRFGRKRRTTGNLNVKFARKRGIGQRWCGRKVVGDAVAKAKQD